MNILYPSYATTLGIEQLPNIFLPPLDAEPVQAYINGPQPTRTDLAMARGSLDESAVAGMYSYYLNETLAPESPYSLSHLESGGVLAWLLLEKGGALTDLPSRATFDTAQKTPHSGETRNQQTYAKALDQLLEARRDCVYSGRTYGSRKPPEVAKRELNNTITTILDRAGINDVYTAIYQHAKLEVATTEARCGAAIVSLATGYVLEQPLPRKPELATRTNQTIVLPR